MGFDDSWATHVSDSGDVLAVTWTEPHGLPPLYFGWLHRGGEMTPLVAMPGLMTSYPEAINAGGVTVGVCTGGYEGPGYPAMWDSLGKPSPPSGWRRSFGPYGNSPSLNDSGTVVLNIGGAGAPRRVLIWEAGRVSEMVPNLTNVIAARINSGGQVVGYMGTLLSTARAYTWERGVLTLLPSASTWSAAYDVNNHGDVCGQIGERAVVWSGGAAVYMRRVPGYPKSYAYGINDKGQVIGVVYDGSGGSIHVLWHQGTVVPILSLFPAGSPFTSVRRSSHINNMGQICGFGRVAMGGERGFVLTPR